MDPGAGAGRPPTPRQLACLAAYVHHGSAKIAAAELGITVGTFKNHLSGLYVRLNALGICDACQAVYGARVE